MSAEMTLNSNSEVELATHAARPATLSIDNGAELENAEDHGFEFSLPPVDGGKEAWLFLAGSFFIEALVWGELYSILGENPAS